MNTRKAKPAKGTKGTQPVERQMISPTLKGAISSEELTWLNPEQVKPDADTTVAVWSASAALVLGWWDDDAGFWRDTSHGDRIDDVVAWADPKGPTP